MRHKPRIVITGIGVVSPIGIGKKQFWHGLFEGRAAAKEITLFDATTYPTRVAGEVRNFDPVEFMSFKEARRMDRSSQMIVSAAKMAVEDSKLDLNSDMSRIGVFTGTAIGGQAWAFREYEVFREKGLKRINPFTAISTFPNASSAQLCAKFGFKGPSDTISSGCVSSTVALGYALDHLKMRRVDVAIVGGTEAPLEPGIFGAYCAARIMTQRHEDPYRLPRPFDSQRDGIVLSEGAAVLVCETAESAVTRGASIYAEIAGWSHNSDSFSMTMLNPDGIQATTVMLNAISDAGLRIEDIDYIQAHAPGSIADDKSEAHAIQQALGDRTKDVPVVAVKSMIGHTQGATGAMETVAAALSIHKNTILQSINCEKLDPACFLNVHRDKPSYKSIHGLLLNTFGFGGKNASLVLRPFPYDWHPEMYPPDVRHN
jgi:3-oxoacyl-[acyl-carrier-protein] synthase II